MFKIKLKNGKEDESPYFYKWGVECLGKSFEFSLSYKELSTLRGKWKLFSRKPGVKTYVESVRNKLKEKREERSHVQKQHQKKRNDNEREAAAS